MDPWVYLVGATIAVIAVPFLPMVMDAMKAVVAILVLFVAFDRGAADAVLQGDSSLAQTAIIAGALAALFMAMLLLPLVLYDRLVALLRLDGLFAYLLFGAGVALVTAVLLVLGPVVPTAEQWAEIAPTAGVVAVPVVVGAFVFWLVAVSGRSRG